MKTTGIILIVISLMAFFGWVGSFAQNKSGAESPSFFIGLLILLAIGIWLINKASNKKDDSAIK